MKMSKLLVAIALSASSTIAAGLHTGSYAQTQAAAASVANKGAVDDAQAPEPLSADEMEILVARIALYPDELVAVIASSSLYPLQLVQAARFLDKAKSKPDLKPDPNWDGSVISLMNYPEIVAMMSDDLDWTEELGSAITYQQKDVLAAIQQLRDKAVAMGVLKSDKKTKVSVEKETIVIQPATAEKIYVPQYPPEMLYEPDYVAAPIVYYPDPYPSYYYPTAPYFAAFVTGVVWGAVVDWNHWGVWGGNGNWGNDINIGCNNCFNTNNGNIDWKNVDRSKVKFDNTQFSKLDRSKFANDLKANDRNNIKNKAADLNQNRPSTLPGKGAQSKDVRKSTLDGLKGNPGDRMANADNKIATPGQGIANKTPGQGAASKLDKTPGQGAASKMDKLPGNNIDRPIGNAKPAARPDIRPSSPSPLGEMNRGQDAMFQSKRGAQSMGSANRGGNISGGGNRGGGMAMPRGGGAMQIPRGGGGGGGRGGARRLR
jgi:hypothetical protein